MRRRLTAFLLTGFLGILCPPFSWAQDDSAPENSDQEVDVNEPQELPKEPPKEEAKAEQEQADPDVPVTEGGAAPTTANEEVAPPADVEVEKSPKGRYNKICKCTYNTFVPYLERRGTWGFYFGVQSGNYAPVNYQPDFSSKTYAEYYTGTTPIEGVLDFTLHTGLGSLGGHITGGTFTASNSSQNAKLSIQPVTVTGILYLDSLFPEPYVVPYGFVGAYTVFYRESVGGLSVSGKSGEAMVFGGGAMFQLDWIDPDAHVPAYQEWGMENTFLFAEARMFSTPTQNVPNFSTPVHIDAGIKIEF